jgi:UDP-N-acetylmuramoylalanine-D-glutamate ligase
VQRAAKNTTPGKIALLSCGSPSFSVWSWFVEKGRLFKQEVAQLT